MSQRICIIGGGGFIGKKLRAFFAERKMKVDVIGRSLNVPLLPGETYYSVAEYSYNQLQGLLAGRRFRAVIDLAYTSIPGTSYAEPVRDFSENLYNVIQHLDFALALKAEKFVYVSSGGTVYGESAGLPLNESSPNFPLSPYGITKLSCERYVYMYHRLHGLNSIIVRPSNIYGPGQQPFKGQGLVATALGLAVKNEPIHVFGDGSHIRDYLYVDDFCIALLEVLEKGTGGEILNIGSGSGVSINQIVDAVNNTIESSGLRLQKKTLPARPFDVHHNVLNIEKLSRQTGWQPATQLQNGIYKTWQWIKENQAGH